MPRNKPVAVDEKNNLEPIAIEWESIGSGGKARLIVKGAETGTVVDVDTVDLSRAPERDAFARRLAARAPQGAIASIERQLLEIAQKRCGLVEEVVEKWPTLVDALNEYRKHERTPVVETGFAPLDRVLGGGLPVGGLVVLSARPNLGKSALALQLVGGSLDLDDELEVVWGLGEMTLEAFGRRSIASWSSGPGREPVSMDSVSSRTTRAIEAADDLERTIASRFHLVPPPLTMDRMAAAVVATGAKLLVVDYLQLVELEGAADRRGEVDGIVKRLRALTLDQGLATLVVSNIAKNVSGETRIGAIGKESSEIDFAADVLLLGLDDDEDDEQAAGGLRAVRWACKKNRHGPCEDVETIFDGSLQTFTAARVYDEFSDFAPAGRRR